MFQWLSSNGNFTSFFFCLFQITMAASTEIKTLCAAEDFPHSGNCTQEDIM